MVPLFNPMACPNLAVPPGIMQQVMQVESGGNPFAIGVVGGRLERQPRNLGEAVATARMLESAGYNYSLGAAQVNRNNLAAYGLDTFERAFDGCANLSAGARILAECYGRSGKNWGKAFSCYYSGDFTTGYRDGYVGRVYDAIHASLEASQPIIVHPESRERPLGNEAQALGSARPGSPAYRLSIRTQALDSAAGALVSAVAHAVASPSPDLVVPAQQPSPRPSASGASGPDDSVFVPRVSGPNKPPGRVAATAATAASYAPGASRASPPAANQTEGSDAAFVF